MDVDQSGVLAPTVVAIVVVATLCGIWTRFGKKVLHGAFLIERMNKVTPDPEQRLVLVIPRESIADDGNVACREETVNGVCYRRCLSICRYHLVIVSIVFLILRMCC